MTTTSPTIPAWMNLDALISPEERARVEEIKQRLRTFMPQVFELARDARWAWALPASRTRGCTLDDVDPWLNGLLGIDEIDDLALLIGLLFQPDSVLGEGTTALKLAERWAENVPGLVEAVQEVSK